MRAAKTTMQFPLTALPEELIALIVENVTNLTTLRHLACTSSTFQRLAEPRIYRYLLIRTGIKAERLRDILNRCPERGTAVNVLDIPCDPEQSHNFAALADIVSTSKNLKELMIESPACNTADFEDEQIWQSMADELFRPFIPSSPEVANSGRLLQNLQRCMLNDVSL